MDYIDASERFNLDKFLHRLTDTNYIDLLDTIDKEIRGAENLKISSKNQYKKEIEYLRVSYVSNLNGLSFLLEGMKPPGVKTEILLKFKPILVELVKKKQLKDSILKLIE